MRTASPRATIPQLCFQMYTEQMMDHKSLQGSRIKSNIMQEAVPSVRTVFDCQWVDIERARS